MSLAGNVKQSHFLAVAGVVLALLGAGGWFAWDAWAEQRAVEQAEAARVAAEIQAEQRAQLEAARRARAEAEAKAAERREAEQARAAAEREEAIAALGPDAREVDVLLLLDWTGRSISDRKQKDVTKGKPYKVNVYQDVGHDRVNRAKVDLDRDDKWDEKWTFEADGGVTRKVAPADDESYTVQERWADGGFVRE